MAAHVRNMRWCVMCQSYFSRATHVWNLTRSASDLTVTHRWKLDPSVQAFLENPANKHRHHPGIMRVRKVQLPIKLRDAISTMIESYSSANLQKQSEALVNYLWSRHRPVEDGEVDKRATDIEGDLLAKEKIDLEKVSEDELDAIKGRLQNKLKSALKKQLYHWTPVTYDAYKGFLYLVGRMAPDYNALYQIFSEIAKRNPSFLPRTFFDFGSGVGSGLWAINEIWENQVKEHYCVDSSGDMNTLARLLLQDGDAEKDPCFPEVHFRQFMPMTSERKYDIVLSAYSLLELPNQTERLNTLYSLWQKTEKYLVIVENGTNAGFLTVAEARAFVLSFGDNERISEEERQRLRGHVFAPCPHDLSCGRLARHDGTPCNFNAGFNPILKQKDNRKKSNAVYSYVVLKKGEKKDRPDAQWPRVVREVSNPSKRVHIRTCCPDGELKLSVFSTARHGRDFYWCAKNCKLGDLLPAVPEEKDVGLDSESNNLEENELHIESNPITNL